MDITTQRADVDWVDDVIASVKAIVDLQSAIVRDLLAALVGTDQGGGDE